MTFGIDILNKEIFPKDNDTLKWKEYRPKMVMETTCGEVPFIVNRFL